MSPPNSLTNSQLVTLNGITYTYEGNDLRTVTKHVKYSVFVPMLVKAMQ